VLIPKLREPDPKVASSVLTTLGIVSCICGQEIVPYLDELFPVIVDVIQDKSSAVRREVAFRTLGHLVQNTGYVIEPYLKYPVLLPTILNTLKSGHSWDLRREVVRVLGIIGALDPFHHKSQEHEEKNDIKMKDGTNQNVVEVAPPEGVQDGKEANTNQLAIPGLSESDEYFPTVAINALMRILRDPGLGQHHNKVVQAVMFIFRFLGLKCIPFLPHVIPHFLIVMRSYDDSLRDSMFTRLSVLVGIVKGNIKSYLDDIIALIKEYWASHGQFSEQIFVLLEQISLAIKEEFKAYLPSLLPLLLTVLRSDKSVDRMPTIRTLRAFEVFGTSLGDYMNHLIPVIVNLFSENFHLTKMPFTLLMTFRFGFVSNRMLWCQYKSPPLEQLAILGECFLSRSTPLASFTHSFECWRRISKHNNHTRNRIRLTT